MMNQRGPEAEGTREGGARESAGTGGERARPGESFEEVIRRLTDVVTRLEGGNLSLEDSLRAFEAGVGLAREAQARLDAAESRIDELLSVDEANRAVTRPFTAASGEERAESGEGAARGAGGARR